MFTGIVEEIGLVERIVRGRYSASLKIRAETVLEGTKVGDSIAVNGICLTVTEIFSGGFAADVMHETLNRCAQENFAAGKHVNLERAMKADGRFGGHIVAGHVDGTGEIIRTQRDDTAVWYTVQAAPDIMRYVVLKGSVTVDGISLTAAAVTETDFSVSVIPHTVRQTVLNERQKGSRVNLETDIIGKYAEKLLCPAPMKKESKITRDMLDFYGF